MGQRVDLMFNPDVISAASAVGEVFALTAGFSGGQNGFRRSLAYGSINPDVLHFGVFTLAGEFAQAPNFFLEYDPSIIPDTDASWRQASISGTFTLGTGIAVYLRANRDAYFDDIGGTTTRWQFTLDALGEFVPTNVYSCNVQR